MAMGFEKNGSTVDMEAGTGRDETVPDGNGGPFIIRAFVDRLKLLIISMSPSSSSSSSLSPPSSSQTGNSTWTRGTNITSRSQLLPTYHTDKHQTHPIVTILKELELGKTMLTLAVPLTTGLIFFYHTESATLVIKLTVISLSVGCAAIWNGILFQETYPRTANVVQQLGISFVFLGLYGVVGSFLSIELIWIPGVCFGSCILPLVVSAFPGNHRDEEGARGN
ncbi:hypothetical protein F0562_033054 [Nyssa sinensis]|uniref:Uncharacterized protein n=1 Tax=Nyssa sinensis TaxID=561372 RepID=A0A5J5ARC2_9ASTE|nr:hypothetical protein F0562_033054 [Nyssa sinensis]